MFDWFPNWFGETCLIVASGPSAAGVDLALFKSRTNCKTIAINNSWKLAPWADVLYAADGNWWTKNQLAFSFAGLKVTVDKKAAKNYGLHLVELTPCSYALSTVKGKLGIGGNSGFHALNLAVQFAAKRIVLVGFDMTIEHGTHWHGEHPRGLTNPREFNMERWRRVLDATAPVLRELGIEVLNTSEVSKLNAFPKVRLSDVATARS